MGPFRYSIVFSDFWQLYNDRIRLLNALRILAFKLLLLAFVTRVAIASKSATNCVFYLCLIAGMSKIFGKRFKAIFACPNSSLRDRSMDVVPHLHPPP